MSQKKNTLIEPNQFHPAPTLLSTEQDLEHTHSMTDNDAIDANGEPPSDDKSITQIETTTEPSTTQTTKRRLWTKLRVPTFERFVSLRPDDARSTVNEMIADRNASEAGNPKRIRSQSPKKPEVETDALWMSDEPLSWEVLAAQVAKSRREVNLRELPLQERALVDEAKRIEWSTMEETGSVLLLTGQISQDVQQEFPHRFVDSRFVLTKRQKTVLWYVSRLAGVYLVTRIQMSCKRFSTIGQRVQPLLNWGEIWQCS